MVHSDTSNFHSQLWTKAGKQQINHEASTETGSIEMARCFQNPVSVESIFLNQNYLYSRFLLQIPFRR